MERLELAEAEPNVRFNEAFRLLRPESRGEWRELGGGKVIFSGPGSPLSQALGLGLRGPIGPGLLDEVEELLGRGGGPVVVSLLPCADASLSQALAQRGYALAEFNQVLVRDLASKGWSATPRVRPMERGEELLFNRTVMAGFLEKESVEPAEAELFQAITTAASTVCFLAKEGDRALGAGSVCIHDEVAILSGTSVLPSARGRGLHRELIDARLAYAAQAGCTLATSSTLPASGSQRNLERAGFRVAYCKAMMSKSGSAPPPQQ